MFDQSYGRGDSFAAWFFAIGVVCASSSVVNARFVMTYGMRAIILLTLTITLGLAALMTGLHLSGLGGTAEFWIYLVWQTTVFYQMGLTIGNLNALAMEPLGHIAGTAASVIGAISTVFAGVTAALVAQTFNGTPLPLFLGTFACTLLAVPLVLRMRQLERRAPAETRG